MMNKKSKNTFSLFGKIILSVFTIIILPYFVLQVLFEETTLKIYTTNSTFIDSNELVIQNIDSENDLIFPLTGDNQKQQITRILILNNDWVSLSDNSKFVFAYKDELIPLDNIVDIKYNTVLSKKNKHEEIDVKLFNYEKQGKVVTKGVNIESSFPPDSELYIDLIIKTDEKINIDDFSVKQISQKNSTVSSKYDRSVSMKMIDFIARCFLAAFIYSNIWLHINIAFGNYSSGAIILRKIINTLFGIDIFTLKEKKRKRVFLLISLPVSIAVLILIYYMIRFFVY